jgi:hypothetical protein
MIRKRNVTLLMLTLISGVLLFSNSCKDDEEDPNSPTPVSLFSDDFKQSDLKNGWTWANEPDFWDINNSRIDYLFFKGNLNANIYCDDNTSRLYQEITSDADFDVSTSMRCVWGNNASDIAGLIVKSKTSEEWILVKLWMHSNGSGRLEFQSQCNDIVSPVPGSETFGGDTEVFLRLKKTGDDYSTYFKHNAGDTWTLIGTTQFDDQLPLQVGFFGGVDSGDGELIIEFDFFRIE